MRRRQSRELALQILFQKEFMPQANTEELFTIFKAHFAIDDGLLDYAKELVGHVTTSQEMVDGLIQKYSLNWNIKRFSLVDLNILRIAVCEMLCPSREPTPPKVAMNEAIEIAKKYSSLESPSFINGILDQVMNKEVKCDTP